MTDDINEHALIQRLRESVQQANTDLADLELAAKTISAYPEDVLTLFDAYLSRDSLLDALVNRSYQHPNGFAKFVLYDGTALPFRLRLHVWPGNAWQRASQEEQNIHGHRWNFGSAVIAGSGLRVDEYVVTESGGEPHTSYRYRPSARAHGRTEDIAPELPSDERELKAVGTALLTRCRDYLLTSGDSYTCGIETLHTVKSMNAGLTATLVAQGPALMQAAQVFRRPDQPYQSPAIPIGKAEVARILSATMRAIRVQER